MKKEINPIVFGVVIALVIAVIVWQVIRSGQLPTSGVTDHTQLRAPAGLPQPPWAKGKASANAPTSVPTPPPPQ